MPPTIIPTVLSFDQPHPKDQLLFFGKPLSLQRYDNPRYAIFNELEDRQASFFWRPKDIKLTADRTSVSRLTEAEKWVWRSNLEFQIIGDSMLSRSINSLIDRCTNSTLEACMQAWAYFETIHSRSYTYLLDNAIADTAAFYDAVTDNAEIRSRVEVLRAKLDALLGEGTGDPYQDLFNAVVGLQIMEGVTFYVSFACSFYFAARGSMVGNGNIIQLIARDENLHVAITQNILKIWRDVPEEGFSDIVSKNKERVIEAYRVAVQAEKDWAQYLFSKGNLVGLTAASLGAYAEYAGNNRLVNQGYPRIFETTSNPFSGWITPFLDSTVQQSAPQETDITAYAKTVTPTSNAGDRFSKWRKS